MNNSTWDFDIEEDYVTGNGSTTNTTSASYIPPTHPELLIAFYVFIFILSVLGNVVVIVTLSCNRRMRDIVNVFLLNLVSTLVQISLGPIQFCK